MRLKDYGRNQKKRKEYIKQSGMNPHPKITSYVLCLCQ